MSDTLINRIVMLSGPMPDAAAHQHYLKTLTTQQLQDRERALAGPPENEKTAAVEFWSPASAVRMQKTAAPLAGLIS